MVLVKPGTYGWGVTVSNKHGYESDLNPQLGGSEQIALNTVFNLYDNVNKPIKNKY